MTDEVAGSIGIGEYAGNQEPIGAAVFILVLRDSVQHEVFDLHQGSTRTTHHARTIGRYLPTVNDTDSLPRALINAAIDYRDAKRLARSKQEKAQLKVELAARIEKRSAYEVKRKTASAEYGHGIPHTCPAGITVDCPLANEVKRQNAQKKGLQPVRETSPKPLGMTVLVPIQRKNLPQEPGKICSNPTSTHFDPEAGLRYEQEFPFRSVSGHAKLPIGGHGTAH